MPIDITRREFLQQSALAALAASSPNLFAIGTNRSKPNILLVMSDEHNPAMTGCYGNSVIHTPHIDALAADGVAFDGHYCNGPLCVPSRLSFTAGKYPSRVDVWSLTSALPSDSTPSIAHSMNAAGYDSLLCGKMHYAPDRRYGFRDVGGDMNQYKKTGKGSRFQMDKITERAPLSPRFKDLATAENGQAVVHDRKVTAGTVDFLSKRTGNKPFFLIAGYLAPHFPLIVPDPFYLPFQDRVAMPLVPTGLVESLPLNYRALRCGFKVTDVPPDKVKYARELYYGLTSWVDNEIGKVMATLRANPAIRDNTIVIYTSDHGEMAGDHSMWWKNCMYESAARVPLIVSYPQRWKGGQRRGLVSGHVDLVQTVLDLGGARAGEDWNGNSMVPWLDNPGHAWKDRAAAEYYAHFILHGFVMYREGRWKYVYHGQPSANMAVQRQLFDLVADPTETHDLSAKKEHAALIEKLHRRMVREVGGDPEETEQRARAQMAKGYAVPA